MSGQPGENMGGLHLDEKTLATIRVALLKERERLEAELAATERDIAGLVADSGDGSGDDLVDAGSKAFEREHEMSIADMAHRALDQTNHALLRVEQGTYGRCESCGNPIGIKRLKAFPRAALCLTCKAAEERT